MMELKPCPFCGVSLEKRLCKKPFGQNEEFYVHPDNGCVFLALYIDKTNCFAWNRRAT